MGAFEMRSEDQESAAHIFGCDISLRMSSSRRAEDEIRDAGASSVASKLTTLIANSGAWSSSSSRDVARITLENVPRPRG